MVYPQRQHDHPVAVRFERMLELLRMRRAEFASPPHVSQQNINTWLRRGKIGAAGIARLRELAEQRGVAEFSEDWINHGLGPEPTLSPFAADVISAQGSSEGATQNGPRVSRGYLRFEYLEGYSKELARFVDIPQILTVSISGALQASVRVLVNPSDALTGVIERGELLFVDTSVRSVESDGIYAYKLAEIAQVRRFLIRGKGMLRLVGTHAYEDSLELAGSELDDLEIGGRVVGRVGGSSI
ncbi:S24 family peptidase [Dyella japonica]|uniref:Peptidase S24/S26A/S26B/S26C domain-containing protein n=1 Tax=Dyella japonica DSM 16301 TaxID=1440762 RepID=A0A0G9HCL5_9GAMM|nr:LexA family transcriptional regulator [Dyella japonica]KLD65447.1 hypothetical protein Y882_02710 [Dyella japonica DSM 16301]